MLTKLVLENFKSFKNRTEIDFKKTDYTFLSQNVADNGILKGAVFVGPNASGKSNIFSALQYLFSMLFLEINLDFTAFVSLLSDKTEFSIEYHFLIHDKEIKYIISDDPVNKIISEQVLLNGETVLIRKGLNAVSYLPKKQEYKEEVAQGTLFLRTLYFNTRFSSNEILQRWMQFLMNSIYKNQIGVGRLDYHKEHLNLYKYLEDKGCDIINEFFEKYGFQYSIEYVGFENREKQGIQMEPKMLFFKRKGFNYSVQDRLESIGNQALVTILPLFFNVLSDSSMLFIDEFSSGFHNDLEELLIRYFMENSINSQLFLVTHSTNVLSNNLLRPDQEFAVDFDCEGSKVKRFSSEQPRISQNIEKMYESGVFGGVPNYSKNN